MLPPWYGLHPAVPVLPADPFTDATVERSVRRGVGFLKPFVPKGNGPGTTESEMWRAGTDALVTYALLHAGESISDSDLLPTSPLMSSALTRLRGLSVTVAPIERTTYLHSVRAQALALGNRQVDRSQLVSDQEWLLDAEFGGAYTYGIPSNRINSPWDGSNSQYGVLGIWAASEAGLATPSRYWHDVERHWVRAQDDDGGWGYEPGAKSSTAMTAAGLATLSVAADQEGLIGTGSRRAAAPADSAGTPPARAKPLVAGQPVTPAELIESINRGSAYLGQGDTLLQPGMSQGYTLYGIERAALATGFRYFGAHDWYRELGTRELAAQSEKDGSWDGRFGQSDETALRLLFLARGRQPLLMNKLRFDGNWDDRPRDVAKLTAYVSAQLERPFAWGVADLNHNWWDWLDASLVYISTNAPPTFTDADVAKLRAYADAGGMIVLHNEFATKGVDAFAADLAKRLFPEYPLADVPAGDLLYRTVFTMKAGQQPLPPLKVVSNGTRPLLVYSPTDLSRDWVAWRAHDTKTSPGLEVGLNLFVAAAGKADFRNRLDMPFVPPVDFPTRGTVPVQRLTYAGGRCDPEPSAWPQFARWFARQTSLKLDVRPTPIQGVDLHAGPVAVLTGNAAVDFSAMDTHALRDFVSGGGTLVIDADGGEADFVKSVRDELLPTAFPGAVAGGMPADHPILAGTGDCMTPLPKPRLRKYATEQLGLSASPPGVQYFTVGSGTVIVSDLDLTTALLHSTTYGVMGYTPDYADGLYKNAILWTLTRFQSAPPATRPAR